MDTNEFYEESTQYFKSEYAKFVEYQGIVKDIFGEFDRICKKNNIPYSMFFGSLLGEVRDGGMVPWDPDMDVCISIEYIDKLIEALNNDLSSAYFFVSNFTNDNFEYFEMKIGLNGYDIYRIHLDVFYIIGVPNNKDSKKFQEKVNKLCGLRLAYVESRKTYKHAMELGETKAGFIARKIYALLKSRFHSLRYINKCFKKLANAANYKTAKYLCIPEDYKIYPYDSIEPMKRVVSNGIEMGFPNKPIEVLGISYKDYSSYPSIEIRFDEYYEYMKLFKKSAGTLDNSTYY